MKGRLRQVGILVLAALILAGLIAGVYAAPPKDQHGKKEETHKQTLGKNWEIKGTIKPKGMPQPKKNLKDTSDPASDRAVLEKRPHPYSNNPINQSGTKN